MWQPLCTIDNEKTAAIDYNVINGDSFTFTVEICC